jgi:hypothetical protein
VLTCGALTGAGGALSASALTPGCAGASFGEVRQL